MKWKCISGGLTLNNKRIPFGTIIDAPKNPGEEHFVLAEDDERPTMKMPKLKKVKS